MNGWIRNEAGDSRPSGNVAPVNETIPWITALSLLALASFILVAGFAAAKLWLPGLVSIVLAGLWLLLRWRRLIWLDLVFLLQFLLIMLAGFIKVLPLAALLIAAIALLSAWDLEHFLYRARLSAAVHRPPELFRLHLQRLVVANLAAMVLALAALLLRVNLGFGTALLVALIAGGSLYLGVGFFSQEIGKRKLNR